VQLHHHLLRLVTLQWLLLLLLQLLLWLHHLKDQDSWVKWQQLLVVSLSAMLLVTQLLELSLEEVVGKLNNINSNQLLHSNINNNLSMDSLKNHKELVLGKSRVLFNVPSNNLIFHSVRDSMRLLDNAKRRMDSKEIFSLDF